jgi:methyltransferase FkbM-like protein
MFEVKALLKSLIPEESMPLRVLRGPFRGAIIEASPRNSFRKFLGIYEHELSGWIKQTLPRVQTVIDVGANDGYFTFGCAAAFRRLGKSGEVIAFEPVEQLFERLKGNAERQQDSQVRFSLHNSFVGSVVTPDMTTLDELARMRGPQKPPQNALIKIDVEGAELEVIAGASSWLNRANHFLIEVHWDETFLANLKSTFFARGLKLKQIDQRALPILGHETRGRNQWWLVSETV